MNQQILVGRLGRNPEFKALSENNSMVRFSLVTNDYYKDKDDKWVETSEWHNIIAFGKVAERMNEQLERGNKVLIVGKTIHKSYTKDGEQTPRSMTQVKVKNLNDFEKIDGGPTRVQEGNKEADKLAEENGFVVKPDELQDFESVDLPKEAKDDGLPF